MEDQTKIFDKAKAILAKAEDFSSFEKEFFQYLRFSGERNVDGATYVIELDENYNLWVQFTDYVFDFYSIIHKSFIGELIQYV